MTGALLAPLICAAGVAASSPATAATPAAAAAAAAAPRAEAAQGLRLARLAWDDDQLPGADDDEAQHQHVLLSAWAGEAFGAGGAGRSSSFFAGEAAWAFSGLDLGVEGAAYRSLREGSRAWTPVALLRITQRFRGRRGAELAFGFGLGAGRPTGWTAWYQVALGVRVPLGPLFLGGELAFEQYDLVRLGGGLGVAF